jgi:DNA-binding transcriptional ArsR family regulator
MSLAAVSKHLKVLETAGLISRGREAQWRPCHLEAAPLRNISDWLDEYRRFWDRSLDSLADYLKTMPRPDDSGA